MAEYLNLFTRVQVRGPVYAGVPIGRDEQHRSPQRGFSYLMGKIGDAQIGPI